MNARNGDGATRYHGAVGSRRLAKICLAFVLFHLLMTAMYLGPTPGPIRRVATAYMEPVFKQSWWVFAPDPVSSNKYLLVRAKKSDGTTTPWFNITSCDIKTAIYHHPVPNRRYLSTFQMLRHLEIGRDNLPAAAKKQLPQDVAGTDWADTLRQRLISAGATKAQANGFVKSDRATDNLASLIAESRWGAGITQIQVQEKIVYTRPFSQRNTNAPLKTEIWQQGFIPYTQGNAQEKTMVDELYGAKAGC